MPKNPILLGILDFPEKTLKPTKSFKAKRNDDIKFTSYKTDSQLQ